MGEVFEGSRSSADAIANYTAFKDGGNGATVYSGHNISQRLLLYLPIAE
jgi:hypothetical protein